MKRILPAVLLLLLPVAVPHHAQQSAPTLSPWLDFEQAEAALPAAEECTLSRADGAARGDGCLKITPPEPMQKVARVTFTLPENFDIRRMQALQFQLRATPTEKPLELRWLAEDAAGETLMQRKFSFDQGAAWSLVDLPLCLWRWGNGRAGDWSEVQRLTLLIETRVSELRLDELQWLQGARGEQSAWAAPAYYDEVAFGAGKFRVSERNGFRISCAASEKLKPGDLERVHERFAPIPAWLKRVCGAAVKPLQDGQPIQVLIFADREQFVKFCERLGTAWRVTIAPPAAGGYAIQDIATSYIDDELGVDRPVFFHETVHAAAARQLRLIPGNPQHSWLQEGLANYLQLCLFPESLGLETYPRLFKEGIGEKTYFLPLKQLLNGRIELRHYAQLAALTAWLVEKHSDWLATITAGLARGGSLDELLKECGTDYESLQRDWLAWGQEKFKQAGERHFDLPAEWVKEKKQPD
ncbi:MAG: hypothetical protein ICCCNLDF_00335 [Planctomycetes bacterium]|nr:hypothetical protein [Planctomycetota bacterium]